jgi:hypothetical protein
LLASAQDLAKKFAETQMLMTRQLANGYLLVVVLWAPAVFLGDSFIAAPNVPTVLSHLLGAIAVGFL